MANSEAFRRAGITDSVSDSKDGAYGRDAGGRLNGWIYEEASVPFQSVLPQPDYAAKKEAVRRACQDALSLGLTAAHTEDLRFLGSVETMLRIHRELQEEGLAFRTHQLLFHTFLREAQERGLRAGDGDAWCRIGAVKLFADGAIGGRTALLKEPYSDAPHTRGTAIHSEEELHAIVFRAREAGYPVAVHAIGDAAAELLADVLERHPLPGGSLLPDRYIHAQVLREETLTRLARLPLAADIQPRFVPSDFPWVLDRVGPGRTGGLYAWRTLLRAGVACAGGSDAPIEPLDPFLGIHAVVTRRKPEEVHEGYLPSEKLTLGEAVRLFTEGSALAAGEADLRGGIGAGKAADFTVVDRPLEGDPDELLKVKVRMTVVNGKMGYESGA